MAELITSEEAARILGVQPQSLAVWRLHGKNLPFVKVGRLVRYRRDELERWIERQTVAVEDDAK